MVRSASRSSTVFERSAPASGVVDEALAQARSSCFWIDDLPVAPLRPTLRGVHRADLVVVGGGYTGLWTAIRAKERDPHRSVALLEGKRLGWAASGRNGGFCAASITHGDENGEARWPEEMSTLRRLGAENLDGIARTVTTHDLDADFERPGTMAVATEAHQIEWLRESADAGQGRFLDAQAVRAELDSPTYLAGLKEDGDALLHPAKMVRALVRLAEELGVEIFEESPALDITSGRGADSRVEVRTPSGTVHADQAALGTNVFPSLLKRYRMHTVPVYDFVIATEPLSGEQMASLGWSSRRGLEDPANQFHYYRLTRDNRIVFGGYDAVYHPGKRMRDAYEHGATHRKLTSHLLTTFPQLEGIRISHTWAGAIDTSTRFCAFHGLAHGGRVAHTAGFTGLGVGATRFAADVMLDQLAGLDTERTRLEMVRKIPLPFPPEPLASLGIQATRWSLDRADHRQGQRNLWLRGLDAVGLGFDS